VLLVSLKQVTRHPIATLSKESGLNLTRSSIHHQMEFNLPNKCSLSLFRFACFFLNVLLRINVQDSFMRVCV
jgi:hypothetical protein